MTSIAEKLRQDFDEGFAKPHRVLAEDLVALLAVLVGGRPYALRLDELSGTAAGSRITPLPSPNPELLGLSGIRGNIVPVFDLAALLSESREDKPPRWLALSAGEHPIAFGFSELEGHLRLDRSALSSLPSGEDRWFSAAVRTDAGLRPVLSINALVDSVRGTSTLARPGKGE